jgi:hypothetical protein
VCIRQARTALWGALQLASNDLPARCVRAAESESRRHIGLSLHSHLSARGTVAGGWPNDNLDMGGEVLTDTEDMPEEEDRLDA